ncbi:MAG: Dabb family protein [Firmicutes bacterium]|nr:Dabb family protein [Bacillota bacterium]
MIKHIVLYTIRDGVDKDATVAKIASLLEPLVGQIPGLTKMEVRRCYQGADYALYSEFTSAEALEGYAVHPLHLAAKAQFNGLLASRLNADYEV